MGNRRRNLAAALATGCALLFGSGCASQSGFIAGKQEAAIQAALARGRFDLGCPDATGAVLSSNYLPAGTSGQWQGIERAEFAIGVSGCEKRASYTVVCPDKTDTCEPAQQTCN